MIRTSITAKIPPSWLFIFATPTFILLASIYAENLKFCRTYLLIPNSRTPAIHFEHPTLKNRLSPPLATIKVNDVVHTSSLRPICVHWKSSSKGPTKVHWRKQGRCDTHRHSRARGAIGGRLPNLGNVNYNHFDECTVHAALIHWYSFIFFILIWRLPATFSNDTASAGQTLLLGRFFSFLCFRN